MRRAWSLLGSTLVLSLLAACGSGGSDGGPGGQSANTGGTTNGIPGKPNSGGSSGNVSGTQGGSSGASGSSSNGNAGGSAATSGSSGGGTTGSPQDCATSQIPPTALRRLTRFEYAQTVKDLLGVDPTPSNDLPADEVTNSFDNNSGVLTVSALHAEKYVLVSEALAKAAVQNLAALTACDTASTGEDACAQQFAKSFGRRAFRRPTTTGDEQMLMTAYAAGRTGGSFAEGIEVMIRAALQSPDFIYRLETTTPPDAAAALVPLSPFELATRLSFMIWATGPDDALLDAAQNGGLATREQVAQKAREMLGNAKARAALANFFGQWSGTNHVDSITKNTSFSLFTADMQAAMERETGAFLDYVLWSGDHSLKTLLTAPVAFVSGPLAQLYVPGSAMGGATPMKIDLPAEQGRSGLLTQAAFLAVQAHPDQTSPVLRGKFVRGMMLCDPPPPPPMDVDISPPTVEEGATARERFSAHESAAKSCAGCHTLMDPIGFAFENFDAVGQYRTKENGRDIDVSGVINDAPDPALQGDFSGVAALGQKLADSQTVRDCVATQWFRFASGRAEGDQDACSLGTLRGTFGSSDGDLIELVVAMTQTDDFWYRAPNKQ